MKIGKIIYLNKKKIILISLMCFLPIQTTSIGISNANTPVHDGIVSQSEYTSSLSLSSGNYQPLWTTNATVIHIAIVCKTTGWVAVGFDPTDRMKDADMYPAGPFTPLPIEYLGIGLIYWVMTTLLRSWTGLIWKSLFRPLLKSSI